MVAPILPIAEQKPNPMVRLRVPKLSVVKGYSIWKQSFMKNLAADEKNVS